MRRPGRGPIPSFPSFASSLPRSTLHVPQAEQGGVIAPSAPANRQTPTQTMQSIIQWNMRLGNVCRMFLVWKLPLFELDSERIIGQWPSQWENWASVPHNKVALASFEWFRTLLDMNHKTFFWAKILTTWGKAGRKTGPKMNHSFYKVSHGNCGYFCMKLLFYFFFQYKFILKSKKTGKIPQWKDLLKKGFRYVSMESVMGN